MFKMNLLNAEEAGKVNGGKLPICKTFDVGTCLVDYFPGCGTRDFIVICKSNDFIHCGVRDQIINPCLSRDFILPCSTRDLVIM